MSSLEFQGKNIDQAVQKACGELNIAPDQIKYEVLARGSSGIFGLAGAKKARIRVSLPEETPEIDLDTDSKKTDVAVLEENIQTETPIAGSGSADGQPGRSSGENPRELAQAVFAILHEEPIPPDEIEPGLSADLTQFCLNLIRKNPEDRLHQYHEIKGELKEISRATQYDAGS